MSALRKSLIRASLARTLAGLALLLPLVLLAQQVPVPALRAHVTDLTGTLTAQQIGQLEQTLAAYEARKGVQLALLIVPTTRPESIEQYSIRVVDQWKLGRKGVDDGALLIVAKDDRELRIEVGRGLEGVLTDLISNRIVEDIIVPNFKAGDYFKGVSDGLDAMMRVVEGEALPPPAAAPKRWGGASRLETLLMIGFVLVFVVGGILRALFGRILGAGLVGGAAGVIATFILTSLAVGVVVGIVAFFVSLLIGAAGGGGRGYRRGGWTPGGFGGGGWGGGGWGGGGGGWSGGGGGFGGGGASGRW
jgi:uncharacterized protein